MLDGNWQTKFFSDYDSLGMLVETKDAKQNSVKHNYDSFDRLIKTVNPDGSEKNLEYKDAIDVYSGIDPIGIKGFVIPEQPEIPLRYEKFIDEVGNTSYIGYGLKGNLIFEAKNDYDYIKSEDSVKSVTWYNYDVLNRVTSSKTERGQNNWDETKYTYDYHFSGATAVDLPGTTEPIHTYVYNGLGQVVKEDKTTDNELRYQYDGAGRLINIQNAKEPSIQIDYSYDRFGNVVSAEASNNDKVKSKVTSSYNARGFLISEKTQIDGVDYELQFTRDNIGNVTKITYPDFTSVNLEYDEIHQLRNITKNGNVVAQFQYNIDGTLASKSYANNLVTNYKYHPSRNWLEEIDVAGVQQLKTTYSYLPNGSVIKLDFNGSVYKFTYDGLNQLKKVTNGVVANYGYDEASNRTSHNLRSYVYLAGNYLERITANTINIEEFSYNQFGSLIAHRKVNQDGEQTREYIYNGLRQIEEIRDNGSTVEKYEYDALGRRIKIIRVDETTVPLYLGNDIVYEKTINGLGQLVKETNYIVVNGVYLAKLVKEGTYPQQLYFYHTDALGSVKAVTDRVGQIVKTFEYDSFGNVTMEAGSLVETPRFTGKPLDSTGLYYFNARYYDPTLGRFISVDPARQGLNWFVYCNNNPLIFVDPDGKTSYWYDTKGSLVTKTWSLFNFYFYEHEQGNVGMDGRKFFRCNSFETIYGPEEGQRPILYVDLNFQNGEFVERLEASKPERSMGLVETYLWIADESTEGVMDQKLNLDVNTLYLFDNTLFNSNEAGNIVWGARMYWFHFDQWYAKALAHGARLVGLQHKFDEAHDQRAIETGWSWAYMQNMVF